MAQTDLETSPIPNTPPPGSTSSPTKAMEGIAIIKAACDAGGLTTKYAKCALLGIIGVESKWEPVQESSNWSESGLKTFSNVSAADASKYARWKGSKQEFFGWLYGTRLNKPVAEGNYFGRGYIQLTFRDNYKRFSTKEYDLVSNPDLLLQAEIAAKVAVAFIKANVRNWETEMNNPGFVFKCQKAVNPGERSGKNYDLKIKYYEYFYGGKAAPVPTDKDASNTSVNKSAKEIADAPQNKKEAYREDRTVNAVTGFCDPQGQYPLRDYMNESDTNRLARGVITGTHIQHKDATRERKIPIANGVDGGSYDQPYSSYNTVYPYNKVYETESGHVMEFDDSPGGERVNIYHRKGTFTEIDPNGTQVNFIVGDGFWITERNGNIFVSGTCNITTGSNCNILVQGDSNVEVNGTSNIILHNDTHIGVATDLNMVVGGNFNLKVDNNFNVQVGNTTSIRSNGLFSLESNDQLLLKTAKSIAIQGGNGGKDANGNPNLADTILKFNGNFKIETPGTYQIKSKDFIVDASNTVTINGKSRVDLNPPGFTPLDPLGTEQNRLNYDGTDSGEKEYVLVDTNLNPTDKVKPEGQEAYNKTEVGPMRTKLSDLTAPETRVSSSVGTQNLPPVERHFSDSAKYETDEEWDTPAGIVSASKQFTGTEYNSNPTGSSKDDFSATGGAGAGTSLDPDLYNTIQNTTDFSSSFRLSPHFTLGMLIPPGIILKDTILPPGKSEPNGRTERTYTKQELVSNLAALAVNILEPIYDMLGAPAGKFGPQDPQGRWCINDGLRNNTNGSDHNKGRAVDIRLNPRATHEEMFEFAKKLEAMLPYNQIILEYRKPGAKGNSTGAWQNWIHISYSTQGNQKMAFTMVDDVSVNKNGFSLYG